MKYHRIGSTDLEVSALGFGCAPIASRAGAVQSRSALRLARDLGINYFDTADMYGQGGSEETLGRMFQGSRSKVIISTKCGYQFSSRLRSLRWIKPLVRPLITRVKGLKSSSASFIASQRAQNFEPHHIEQAVHGSLRRLRTDYIDLLFLHDPPSAIADRGDVFEKLATLKAAGKIRHYGASCDLDAAAALLKGPPRGLSALQLTVNLLEQAALTTVVPSAARAGMGVIARQPFANGRLLSGNSRPATGAGLPEEASSIAALALRFLLQFPEISTILPSMMRRAHVQANVAAIEAGPLPHQESALLAAAYRQPHWPNTANGNACAGPVSR